MLPLGLAPQSHQELSERLLPLSVETYLLWKKNSSPTKVTQTFVWEWLRAEADQHKVVESQSLEVFKKQLDIVLIAMV